MLGVPRLAAEEIYIDADRVTPDCCLLLPTPELAMGAYGHVQLRWCVPGVMEIPRFCIGSAMSDQCRVKWGLGPHRIEMLKAATTLRPSTFDVFGFFVPTKGLIGAAEFVGHQQNDLFDSHIFSIAYDCDIDAGDELWGWYAGGIGEARIEAKRLIAIDTNVSGQAVPALERPEYG